ncbi:hypothetical protein DH86_00001373, partial [Scytalidium sp. 3C]
TQLLRLLRLICNVEILGIMMERHYVLHLWVPLIPSREYLAMGVLSMEQTSIHMIGFGYSARLPPHLFFHLAGNVTSCFKRQNCYTPRRVLALEAGMGPPTITRCTGNQVQNSVRNYLQLPHLISGTCEYLHRSKKSDPRSTPAVGNLVLTL